MNNKQIQKIAYILVLIGGLNWGIWGVLKVNMVTAIFGGSIMEEIIYTLIGLSALFLLVNYNSKKK